jgi:hypothetical protein
MTDDTDADPDADTDADSDLDRPSDDHQADDEAPGDDETPDESGDDGHALPPEDLQYPEFVFDDGEVGDRGGFDLAQSLSREELVAWLEDLAGGLESHDVAVESPDGHVRFGVGPGDVEVSFDPDDEFRGELEFTVRLGAKVMFASDDPDAEKVGARGGKGFVPLEQLTDEADDYRCYNWIDDPTDP